MLIRDTHLPVLRRDPVRAVRKTAIVWIGLLAVTRPELAEATVRHVPAQYTEIHTAIEACAAGDTVLVQAGLYETILGSQYPIPSAIVILAADGRDKTIWEVNDGLRFPDGPGSTVLDGFFLRVDSNNGGVHSFDEDFVFRNNYLWDWSGASVVGAGVLCSPCGVVENNIISSGAYIGVWVDLGVTTTVRGNLFVDCDKWPAWAIEVKGRCDSVFVRGNTFGGHNSKVRLSVSAGQSPFIEFVNNIFTTITPSSLTCEGSFSEAEVTARFNLFEPGYFVPPCVQLGPQNIFDEPARICYEWCTDYRLRPDSPAVGSGEGGANMGAPLGVGCEETVEVSTFGVSGPARGLGPASPNPSSGLVRVPVPDDAEEVVLLVYDVSGRLVRTVRGRSAGARWIGWDGSDDRGRAMAAGVYGLVLNSRGQVLSRQGVRRVN
jgi:hypothetical protein